MKIYIKSTQSIFAGTRYDKQAAKILVDAGIFNEAQANAVIDGLFHQDLHAFVHAPNWLEKYLKGIARMCVEEGHGTAQGVADFLTISTNLFDQFLTFVREHREELGGAAFDNKFITTMSYQDVVNFMDTVQNELDKYSDAELAELYQQETKSNYKLVPIESYEQFHEMFGGHWTGDGSSDNYAGGGDGGTAWCHANSRPVYDDWVKRGKLFVLANRYFKRIKFNPESNRKDPKDKYGNSLICICVNKKSGKLLNATLRCNHVGVSGMADNQYQTYSELSRIVGFNVKEAVGHDLGLSITGHSGSYPSTFAIGDIINVDLDGAYFNATAIRKTSQGMMFVFADIIENAAMQGYGDTVSSFLQEIKDAFPKELHDRLIEIRLPQASEVFSDIEDIFEWKWLSARGATIENPQIPYFQIKENRAIGDWWWLSTILPDADRVSDYDDNDYYAVVDSDGECNGTEACNVRGVRPVFIIKDLI